MSTEVICTCGHGLGVLRHADDCPVAIERRRPAVLPPRAPDVSESLRFLRFKTSYRVPGLDGTWRIRGLETTNMAADGTAKLLIMREDVVADPVATARAEGITEGRRWAIDALRAIVRSPEDVPEEWLHAIDAQAPGRFGFGVNDSAEVEDLVRAIIAAAGDTLESLAAKEADPDVSRSGGVRNG